MVPPDENELRLRSAIFASPHLDAPRQVYADWLLERDDWYGRFIIDQLRGAFPACANMSRWASANFAAPSKSRRANEGSCPR